MRSIEFIVRFEPNYTNMQFTRHNRLNLPFIIYLSTYFIENFLFLFAIVLGK